MLCDSFRIRPLCAALASGVLALALATAPVIPAPTPMPDDAAVTLPDTAPGTCANAFIHMLNNPALDVVHAFEKQWASKSRQSARSNESRSQGLAEMKREHGGFHIEEVLDADDNAIVIMVSTTNGVPMQMEFMFSSKEPGKLDAVQIAIGSGASVQPQALTTAQRDEIIAAVLTTLKEQYVYPEVAEKMATAVDAHVAAGAYDDITNDVQLARQLMDDLRDVSKDGHLGVRVAPAPPPSAQGEPGSDDDELGLSRDMMRRNNYAFRKAELLPGNIGYLRFDAFIDDDAAKATASAALAFMQHADALIFDLRSNGGGSPEMIRFIQSYLFDTPTHLNSMKDRNGETIEEYWTVEDVPAPAKRFANDLPVYVLTSDRTFSGAEEFSYNLKNLKRGVIVGETTGGGAHPVMGVRVNDRIVVMVPFMRAWNPISKTNWEGAGVAPDVECTADEALDVATELAMEAIERRRHADE
jgi:hypothetical protein